MGKLPVCDDPVELSRLYEMATAGHSLVILAKCFGRTPAEIWVMLKAMGGAPGGQTWGKGREPTADHVAPAKRPRKVRVYPKLFTPDQETRVRELSEGGMRAPDIAAVMGCSMSSVYRVIRPPLRGVYAERKARKPVALALRAEGLDTAEIARRLDVTTRTVRNIFRRADRRD